MFAPLSAAADVTPFEASLAQPIRAPTTERAIDALRRRIQRSKQVHSSCNVLRDDRVGVIEYTEQRTYLLFLKWCTSAPPESCNLESLRLRGAPQPIRAGGQGARNSHDPVRHRRRPRDRPDLPSRRGPPGVRLVPARRGRDGRGAAHALLRRVRGRSRPQPAPG